jgi:hypothetical protein
MLLTRDVQARTEVAVYGGTVLLPESLRLTGGDWELFTLTERGMKRPLVDAETGDNGAIVSVW